MRKTTYEELGTHTPPAQLWNHQKLLPDEIHKLMKKPFSITTRTNRSLVNYLLSEREARESSQQHQCLTHSWAFHLCFISLLEDCWPVFWGSLKRAALKRCDNLVHVESHLENWDFLGFLTNPFWSHHKGDSKNSWDFILGLPWHKAACSFWVLAPNKCMFQENIRVLSSFPLWFFLIYQCFVSFQTENATPLISSAKVCR